MKTCITCHNGTTIHCRHVVGLLTGAGNARDDVAAWVIRQNAILRVSQEHEPDATDNGCPAWEGINTDGVSS